MASATVCYPAATLRQFTAAVLERVGLPAADAALVAKRMIEADLSGQDGHGIFRLPQYVRRIRGGAVNVRPAIRITQTAPGTALVDGDNGMGQLVMTRAAEAAIELARAAGVGWVGVRASNHAGTGALYATLPLAHDMVGIYTAVANANHMAPWGGQELLLGTNPLAIAVPAAAEPPVVLDMATRILLDRHGLNPERDATVLQLGTAQDQLNALVAGAVDAATVALPTNLLAERLGFPLLEDTKQHNVAFPTNVIAVRRPYLESHPEEVRRYLQAHIEAVERLRRDKALAKRLLAKGTNTDDAEILERSYQLFIEDLQDVPYPSAAAFQGVLDLVARERPSARDARPSDFYDDRLVRQLAESGFIRGLRGT